MAITDDISIKPVNIEDLDKVAAFRKLFIEPDAPLRHIYNKQYYSWHAFENPIKGGSFWAAYYKDKVIGMSSLAPKSILINSQKYTICERCDAFVHPDYQGRKIWSRLYQQNRETIFRNGLFLEYSFPTPLLTSVHIQKYHAIKLDNFKMINLILPLNLQGVIKLKLGSGVISKIIPNFMKLPFNFFSKTIWTKQKYSRFLFQKEDSLPHEYSKFWKESQNVYQFCFGRDAEYMKWRYFSVPEPFEFFSIRENNSMTGCYVIKKIPWQNLYIGNIVDFFFAREDKLLFRSMLISAIQQLLNRNVDLIQTWCLRSSPYFKWFVEFGFLPLRKINSTFSDQEPFSSLKNEKIKAHVTMGDSDLI